MNSSTVDSITELLFMDLPLQKADLIFVFGNDWIATMEDVATLYKSGCSQKVLVTGHSANKDRSISEAQRFRDRGMTLGIPAGAFLLEHEATNTKENLEYSLPLIEASIGLGNVSSILFVCKTFHCRRVYMTARKFLPGHISIGLHPVSDERDIRPDNWWKDKERFERVISEVRRIAEYTLKGDLSIQ